MIINILVITFYIVPIYALCFSEVYISHAWIQDSKLHFIAGKLYDYFVIGGVLSLIYSLLVLIIGFKLKRGMDRVRLVYIAIGIFVWLGFIGIFTFLLRLFGLPEYNFIAPIGCTLATAIWSIGIIRINLFEIPESAIINDNNSFLIQTNVMILKIVDALAYSEARKQYRKRVIKNIIGDFTELQINSDLTLDEIYDRMAT